MYSESPAEGSRREIIRHLSGCRLFSHLDDDALRDMMSRYICRYSHYGKGSLIYMRGDEYSELAVLLSGSLKAEMVDICGHTLTVERLKAARPIASSILFADKNYMPVDILAETDVEFIRFSKLQVRSIAQGDPVFFERLLEDMGDRVVSLSSKLWATHFNSLKENMAGYLLRQAERSGSKEFTITRTKKQLADLFGVARGSVNRLCARLAEEGIIEFKGRHFKLLQEAKLIKMVSDDE